MRNTINIFKTKKEVAEYLQISTVSVNNQLKKGKVIRLEVGKDKESKKAGYIILNEFLKTLVSVL